MPARSFTVPRSPVHVTTSKPCVSRSHATATDVSSPPEYARTQVWPFVSALMADTPPRSDAVLREPVAQRPCPGRTVDGREDRVVARDRADDVRDVARVERDRERVRGPGRRSHDDHAPGGHRLDRVVGAEAPQPLEPARRGDR